MEIWECQEDDDGDDALLLPFIWYNVCIFHSSVHKIYAFISALVPIRVCKLTEEMWYYIVPIKRNRQPCNTCLF